MERQRPKIVARLGNDRRQQQRRSEETFAVVASHWVFDRLERLVFKKIDRRRELRRKADETQRVAGLS